MSVQKFKPIIWAKEIEEGLERDSVFYEDCNHEYEGLAEQPGDSIKILGIGEPTVRDFSDGKLHELDSPETIEDNSMTIPINQVCDFNFFVDDLDKRQTEGKLLDIYTRKAKHKLLQREDKFIANMALHDNAYVFNKSNSSATTADTILGMIDKAYTALLKKDVPLTKEVIITLDFDHLEVLRTAYEKLDTNNSQMMKNGRVGMYHNIIVKASNNVAENGGYKYIQLKTRDAISFVRPHIHLEAYKPEKYFGDAVKGYEIFDGDLTGPNEMVVIKSKIA